MSLKQKFLWRNWGLVFGLVLIGAAALWGLDGLRRQLSPVLQGYADMGEIQQAQNLITSTLAALKDANTAQAKDLLSRAAGHVTKFIANEKDNYYMTSAQQVLARITEAQAALAAATPDPAAAAKVLQTTDQPVAATITICHRFIEMQQRGAAHRLMITILMMAGVIAGTVVAGAVTSIVQYREVMAPLERLRAGVRRLAAAQFNGTLEETGEKEFVELAVEFNRMAAELESFYRSLEEKVLTKSRELVRSERLASVGFLAAGVSHEINNPLNIISGYAELSLKRLASRADADAVTDTVQVLQVIRDEAFRCKEITNKLLSLAKGDSGNRAPLALESVAREVAVLAGGLRDYTDRCLELKFDGPLDVVANATEMKQVFLNLTVNALQSVKPGEGRVLIEGRRRDGWVEVSVCDNGYGMSPDSLKQVFEPFYTRRPGARTPGTGLGLSITHAIIESHGGRIRAESAGTGRGSRFTVELPAVTKEGA
ncbi:MAG TPA: HAMP domain-containing sensor histidine kinase [Tepidisphaeraceae bacterium]|nr:HAMP domain-containing sensor histidine kinase [Tepidisphaeraceae bacterium]